MKRERKMGKDGAMEQKGNVKSAENDDRNSRAEADGF